MKTGLLLSILAQRRFVAAALVSLAAYVVLYLAAMQYLVIAPHETGRLLAVEVLPDWRGLAFRQRGPFLFEPIGVLHVGSLAMFLSIPNLAIALGLGLLVGANVAASYYGFRELGTRGLRGVHALIGTIPALVSGAACCVPTLILVIGLQLTATVATVWSSLAPASALLLALSLWWSLRRIAAEGAWTACRNPREQQG
ncbi:MAG: hypothetical protein A3G81_13370 [Betaproteobacteria bacterium RIFCSPLOWO2_12_FULL_65_14]|nr:MAG: hypothetical protein A3G81_13370 [Betaproteobacteria bacterium RIFCSPLOWO2_12_FULL_65_14]